MKEEDKISLSWRWVALRLILSTDKNDKTYDFDRDKLQAGANLTSALDDAEEKWPQLIIDSTSDEEVNFHLQGNPGKMSVSIPESAMVNIVGVGTMALELVVKSVNVKQWDDTLARFLSFDISLDDWCDMVDEENPESTYRIARAMEAQHPEALDIIAEYMSMAAEYGSHDAQKWLEA